MIPVAVASISVLLAGVALWRLPPLHPAQLWTIPWAAMTVLYALPALPYRDMSLATAAIVIGALLVFTAVAWRAGGKNASAGRLPGVSASHHGRVRVVGVLVGLLAAVWLGAFLLEVSTAYGVRAAFVSSPDVRRALGAGEFAVTIKYMYAALAAGIACALAAGTVSDRKRRRRWLVAAASACLMTYFSTGRSNVVTAVLMTALCYAAARPVVLRRRDLVLASAGTAAIAVAALLAGGSLVGKTYANSELATMDTPFSRSKLLQPLALPYLYATAPLASLNELVAVTDTLGESDGCATVALVCSAASAAGLAVEPVPAIRSFTSQPLSWNTYTALDAPLLDGGLAMALLIVAIFGGLVGGAWRLARQGRPGGVVCFAVLGTAALFSTTQNNFFASHYLGAMLLWFMAWLIADRGVTSGAGSVLMRLTRRFRLVGSVFLIVAVFAGCGSNKSSSRALAERSVIDSAPPLREVLITERDLARERAGTTRKAFLGFWQALQYQAIAEALDDYHPRLIEVVGAEEIAEALKGQAAYFRSVKPRITGVRERDGRETLLYEVKDISGVETPRSITWQRVNGSWHIYYDSFLDGAIRDAVQNGAQVAIDPRAQTPSPRAVQAGYNASRLQSLYLDRLARATSPRRTDADGAP